MHVGQCGADLATDLDSVSVRQPNIEHCHVGSCGGDPGERLGCRGRFTDDLQVVLEAE